MKKTVIIQAALIASFISMQAFAGLGNMKAGEALNKSRAKDVAEFMNMKVDDFLKSPDKAIETVFKSGNLSALSQRVGVKISSLDALKTEHKGMFLHVIALASKNDAQAKETLNIVKGIEKHIEMVSNNNDAMDVLTFVISEAATKKEAKDELQNIANSLKTGTSMENALSALAAKKKMSLAELIRLIKECLDA